MNGWRPAGGGRLEGGVSVYGSSWNSPGFVSVADFNAGRLTGAMDVTDGGSAFRGIAHGRFTTVAGATSVEATGWMQRVHSSVYLTIPEDGELEQSDEEDRRTAVGGRLQASRPVGAGDVSAGLDGRLDFAAYDLFATEARDRQAPTGGFDARYAGGGAFVRWRSLIGPRVALDLGARADAVHYRSLHRVAGTPRRTGGDVIVSPKLGARYFAGGGWSALASLSQGFRSAPGVIGDPTIEPVRGWSKEIGARYDGGAVTAQVALFRLDVSHERIQDPITRDVLPTGRSTRQGINVDAGFRLTRALSLVLDGTLNDARVNGGRAATVATPLSALAGPLHPSFHVEPLEAGSHVPNVARWLGRVGVEATLVARLDTRAMLRFSGPYTPIGEPEVETRSFAVLDLGTSIQLARAGAVLDVELQNVLDAAYPEIRASGFLNPGAPRTLRAALRLAGQP